MKLPENVIARSSIRFAEAFSEASWLKDKLGEAI